MFLCRVKARLPTSSSGTSAPWRSCTCGRGDCDMVNCGIPWLPSLSKTGATVQRIEIAREYVSPIHDMLRDSLLGCQTVAVSSTALLFLHNVAEPSSNTSASHPGLSHGYLITYPLVYTRMYVIDKFPRRMIMRDRMTFAALDHIWFTSKSIFLTCAKSL